MSARARQGSHNRGSLNWVDRAIAVFSPASGVQRAQARRVLAAYDAAQPSRLRKLSNDRQSGDMEIWRSAVVLRAQARELERNYDLARGILNVLVNKVVGPHGISVEPMVRGTDGELHDALIKNLSALWKDWTKAPEVSFTMNWAQAQRMAARTWFRDGEVLSQVLEGNVGLLDHGTQVPLSLELLEPDLCPFEYFDIPNGVFQGIGRNAWGEPRVYWLYKQFPGDKFYYPSINQLKTVSADRMLHVATRDRLSQLRGVTQFASIITRLDDIKDYEESERVAAKVAASMAAYIKKGDAQVYTPAPSDDPVDISNGADRRRQMKMQPGMIFDDLLPGEEIGIIDSKRPSTSLEPFRDGQLRAVAAGVGAGYSSISKNYNGTYSAQRQELVEQFDMYQSLTGDFVSRFNQPVWERFVSMALASGKLVVPRDVDRSTLYDAYFQGPALPWIDPEKEANANLLMVRSGFKSLTQVARERNTNARDLLHTLASERRLAQGLDLVLQSDAKQVDTRGQTNPTEAAPDGAATPAAPGDDAQGSIRRLQ